MLQDLRYGLRTLARSPGFTIAALVTLALTMGAVSTVLSLANALVLRPIAADRPEELVVVAAVRRNTSSSERVSYADFAHIRDHATSIRDLSAHGSGGLFLLTHHGATKKVSVAIVSAGFFPLLGVKPALGRFFTADEDRVPGRDNVAVLSHQLWHEAWDDSPAAVGAVVKVNGVAFTVIGVAPASFYGLDPRPSEVYVPTMMLGRIRGVGCDAIADPDCAASLQMVGRLRDGRTLDNAKAEVALLAPPRWRAKATDKRGPLMLAAFRPRGAYGTYGEFGLADAFPEGPALFLVAGLCLLLGCANLGALLFARGTSRARELAIRASLGPTPFRLLRQLMTESLLLAIGGGALGFILSTGLTRVLSSTFYRGAGAGVTRYDLGPDAIVAGGAAALSLGAGFLFGLLPALKAIRLGAALTLSRQASTVAPRRLARWLMGAQIAVALALVALTALLWSSARHFVADGHFDARHVALLNVEPGYPEARTREFQRAVVRRLETLPGVLAVSLWNRGGVLEGYSTTVSRPAAPGRAAVEASAKEIGSGYFAVLGTPVRRGRDFDARDSVHSPPVAIVDESLVHRLWPEEGAIGATLVVDEGPPAEVVGVVADVGASVRGDLRVPHVYRPFWQIIGEARGRYCVRVQGDPAAALPMLIRAVNEMDPDVPVTETMPMTTHLAAGDELKAVRMTAAIAGYAAVLAVLLCAIGIYGTIAFSVARRTKEIGVRIAVGAGPRDVIGLIIGEEMRVVLSGVGLGLALAWGGSRLLRYLLYGAGAGDDVLYAGAAVLVTGVGLLACWLPARRAARLDPMAALKAD